jgi:SAM-dependent methyltransferase
VLLDKPRVLELDGVALNFLAKRGKSIKGGWSPKCINDVTTVLYAASQSDQEKQGTISYEKFLDSIYSCHLQAMTSVMGELLENRVRDNKKMTAPYVPTPVPFINSALQLVPLAEVKYCFDLGCGDGRTLALALKHGVPNVVGIDLDANHVKTAASTLAQAQAKLGVANTTASVVQQNCFDFEFEKLPANSLVYMYLMPDIINTLAPRMASAPVGTYFLLHDFVPAEWEAFAVHAEEFSGMMHRIHAYKIGEHLAHTIDLGDMQEGDHALIAERLVAQIMGDL